MVGPSFRLTYKAPPRRVKEQGEYMTSHQHSVHRSARPKGFLYLVVFLAFTSFLFAQQPADGQKPTSSLPDAPQPQQSTNKGDTGVIGYVTNGSLFFPDIATTPGPLSTGGKFKLFVNQSISPPFILAAAASAAVDQATDYPEGYGQGWDAYGKRFGANMARASSTSFFGTFAFASLFRQDPRFFPQTKPTLWGSVKYSALRVVVTRNDSGSDGFNASGLLGSLAAETLANTYLPVKEQTGAKTLTRFGSDLGWKFGGNMFKNYWPTLFQKMGLKRLKVIPAPASR